MATELDLCIPVTNLRGVGPQMAERLARLGIQTIQDLLFHLPTRYQDRTRITPIGTLRPGDNVLVEGEIQQTETLFRRQRMLLVHISDGTGGLLLRFFHFNKQQQNNLAPGTRLRCYGETRTVSGQIEMTHPEYRRISNAMAPVDDCLTPIYPVTEGLQQRTLQQLTGQALQLMDKSENLPDWIPPHILSKLHYPELKLALRYVHRPPPEASVSLMLKGQHPSQQRLAFEELLAHQLSMRLLRSSMQRDTAPRIAPSHILQAKCQSQLPFKLTHAQQRVIQEINQDLNKPHPSMRLIQGDVGSGKTVVAIMAALQVIEAGYQVAIMTPTELLAEQHYRNFHTHLASLGIQISWLSGRIKGRERQKTLTQLACGDIALIIGTHALFQEDVTFKKLGLLIIDEQHRFGVHQRLALREKGIKTGLHPHQITMTATPIPRTLAMTAYADLDYSIIDELPPGRKPITTIVIPESRREEIVQKIQIACAKGQQAYWVCTLIEESDALQCQTAEDTAIELKTILPNLTIGLIHGRMKPTERDEIMRQFHAATIHLLVATTVIEVGMDIPNACLMIIENAERFGLAQLHQLRGRIGRGSTASNCVLMYKPPLTERARARLNTIREYQDGFEIAKIDLEIRGPGEILGTRQTGLINFKVADIIRDTNLLPLVQKTAGLLIEKYPDNVAPLVHRWLGNRQQFRQA